MNAVGIDKSNVAVLRPFGEIVVSPFNVYHNPKELWELVTILKIWIDTKIVIMDKKRSKGKHFYVYMTAAANKFLRIYFARVMDHLNSLKSAA